MQRTRRLASTLSSQQFLRFYEIMNYPVPTNAELYFQFHEKDTKQTKKFTEKSDKNSDFSRSKKNQYLDEYLNEIRRLETTFKSIPFVDQIFLCNSITFNALDENSDIDLFIIARPGRIWSVKFRSMLLFTLKGAKRLGKNTRKKICLSFFITSDYQNLYHISLQSLDVYLAYRIAHLVEIYPGNKKSDFFSHNKRVKGILPNFPEHQTISLGIEPFSGNTKFKNFLEYIGNGWFGNLFEFIIKHLQKAIILIKIALHPNSNKDVIISDSMLKFHQDIREKISLKYNVKVK